LNTLTKSTSEKAFALKPEVKINLERCAGCQECIMRCPTQALSLDIINWKASADNNLCVGCRQCQRTCPFSAITVSGPRVVAERTKIPSSNGRGAVGKNDEVRPGFTTLEEAVAEANRCLNCPDPTCVRGCPAHNDIPRFIQAIRDKDLERAQKVISETSCLPDVCSRICNWGGQCEGACNWSLSGGEPVAIGKLERFVADNNPALQIRRTSERGRGLSVGIVGSGPAGIAAAWELASAGAAVTIYEREIAPGG
jgi:glutamate synthase (NADPH/NADH) small chain